MYELDRKPAGWVMRQSLRRERRLWIVGGLTGLLAMGALVGLATGYHVSAAALVGLLAIALILRPHAIAFADRHLRMLNGAVAERRVGETLNELLAERWVVMHDIQQRYEGNIDHLVSGPNGVYLIETKAHRYREVDLVKAKRQAAKLGHELGVWVTPVICLDSRQGGVFKTRGVSVVPRDLLLDWLRSQRNKPVEFKRLAEFAGRV